MHAWSPNLVTTYNNKLISFPHYQVTVGMSQMVSYLWGKTLFDTLRTERCWTEPRSRAEQTWKIHRIHHRHIWAVESGSSVVWFASLFIYKVLQRSMSFEHEMPLFFSPFHLFCVRLRQTEKERRRKHCVCVVLRSVYMYLYLAVRERDKIWFKSQSISSVTGGQLATSQTNQ